ncbi:MAG: hypothetical protein GY814_17695 [Gammaproteobacteria bacterium]|nr:hypothetical protein [Gammaproteobacteria bacterium]
MEVQQLPHGTLDLQSPSNTEYGPNSYSGSFIGQHMQHMLDTRQLAPTSRDILVAGALILFKCYRSSPPCHEISQDLDGKRMGVQQLAHGTLDLPNPSNTKYGPNSVAALFTGQHMQHMLDTR